MSLQGTGRSGGVRLAELLIDWADRRFTGRTRYCDNGDGDFPSFAEATMGPPPVRTNKSIIEFVRKKDQIRLRRLQEDFAWFQRTLEKIGISKEEARFLL